MSEERRLPIIYHIKHVEDGLPVSELPPGHGLADSIFISSVINDEEDDSKRHFSFLGLDGTAGTQMSEAEVFETWIMMAHMMSENKFFEEEDPRHTILHSALDENSKFTDTTVEEIEDEEPKRIIP